MIRNVIQCIVIVFVVAMLTAGGKLGLFKKEGDRLTEKAKVSFIDFELKEKEMGETINGKELVVYYGKIKWNEQSGVYGQPAEVPVQILKPISSKKCLVPKAAYFPSEDGKFYFVVEKVEADYILAAFPQRADPKTLPQKVREFFDKEKRDANNRQREGNQIH